MTLDNLAFADFSASTILRRHLADIRGFRLAAEITPVYEISDDALQVHLASRIYEHLREVIKEAKFFYEDELQTRREGNQIAITYDDDRFDFSVVCSESWITIRRRGSGLSNFHKWYTSLMPSAQGIMGNACAALNARAPRKIDIMRAFYRYDFLLYDIKADSTGAPVKNSEIMQKLLRGYPDEKGRITELQELSSIPRTDVTLGRWVGLEGRRRRLRYSIEAPANMGWSSLWLTFEYIGESYTSPDDNHREGFSSDIFLAEYDRAYVEFLRDNAINGFMEWLMHGYTFRSTAAGLP